MSLVLGIGLPYLISDARLKFGYNCFSKCVDVSWGWGMSSLTLTSLDLDLDLESFQVILESLLVIFNPVDTALKLTKDVVNVVSVSVGSLNFRQTSQRRLLQRKKACESSASAFFSSSSESSSFTDDVTGASPFYPCFRPSAILKWTILRWNVACGRRNSTININIIHISSHDLPILGLVNNSGQSSATKGRYVLAQLASGKGFFFSSCSSYSAVT